MRSFVRRRGLPYERRKANLAEPPRPEKVVALDGEKFRHSDRKTEFFNTIGPMRTFEMGPIAAVQLPVNSHSSNSKP